MVQMHDQEELQIFLEELNENLNFLDSAILALEENPEEKALLTEIFRVAHTVKGNAGFLNLKNLVDLGHSMEEVFQKLQCSGVPITTEIITTLFECKDAISAIGSALSNEEDPNAIETSSLIGKVNSFLEKNRNPDSVESEKSPTSVIHQVNMKDISEYSEITLDTLLVRAWISSSEQAPSIRAFLLREKLLEFAEIKEEEPSDEIKDSKGFNCSEREIRYLIKTNLKKKDILKKICIDLIDRIEVLDESDFKKIKEKTSKTLNPNDRETLTQDTVRIQVERLDTLLNLVGELVIANSGLTQIQSQLKDLHGSENIQKNISQRIKEIFRVSANIQELVTKSRLVPIGSVFNRFKRFVRDYGARTKKKINLELSGHDTEIDKKIIDEMIKPMTHIVRNSVDHGIEDPAIRTAKGKDETGLLKLYSYQEGNYIHIVIQDDGMGINTKKVLKKAIEKGVLTREEAESMRPEQVRELIFQSGFSTKEDADDISGRGIGMDIVKTSIEKLNGSIEITSEKDVGTKIVVKLPLTLAIVNALTVKISDQIFSIPMSSIVETQKINSKDIIMVEGVEMIRLRNTLVPLIRLEKILEIESYNDNIEGYSVIIVEYNDALWGLLINEFQGRYEMVIKSLADHYRPIEGISGVSILGDGSIILILDIQGIINLHVKKN